MTKVNSSDDLLAGATFELYNSSNVSLGTYTTNGNGVIEIDELAYEEYYFVETIAPSGYQLDRTPIHFSISATVKELTVTNIKSTITPVDPTPPDGPDSDTGSVSLKKVNSNGATLAGATFELYRVDGTLFGTYTTDDAGSIKISGLAYGNYYFVETVAPTGYQLDSTPITFTVSATAVTLTVQNELSSTPIDPTPVAPTPVDPNPNPENPDSNTENPTDPTSNSEPENPDIVDLEDSQDAPLSNWVYDPDTGLWEYVPNETTDTTQPVVTPLLPRTGSSFLLITLLAALLLIAAGFVLKKKKSN